MLASTWFRHFKRKPIAQRCRQQKTRVGEVDYSWKLHENSTVITREKRGQTFRDRNVWPRFSVVKTVEFACNFRNYLWPLPVSFDVGSAALSASVQNVVTTWFRHFERKSITQRFRRQKTRVGAVDYSWKLHANLTVITREKRGQTCRGINVWPRFSGVMTVEFACNFHE